MYDELGKINGRSIRLEGCRGAIIEEAAAITPKNTITASPKTAALFFLKRRQNVRAGLNHKRYLEEFDKISFN